MNSDSVAQSEMNAEDFSKYFIVKIAGKGNILSKDDPRYKLLVANLNDTIANLEVYIEVYNSHHKTVLIMWDGDNYQGSEHQKPSPFTDLILRLSSIEKYKMAALKHKKDKTNPWKEKHVDTWHQMEFDKYYTTQEPHNVVNSLCDMYVSYGSTNFQYKDDDETSKIETSGYSQLQEVKAQYKLVKQYENPDHSGIEIYVK